MRSHNTAGNLVISYLFNRLPQGNPIPLLAPHIWPLKQRGFQSLCSVEYAHDRQFIYFHSCDLIKTDLAVLKHYPLFPFLTFPVGASSFASRNLARNCYSARADAKVG